MNMPGSLSIARKHVRWNSALFEAYLSVIAVGILSGIIVAYARTPMHLPGHKAILWMAPLLAARMVTRTAGGCSVGALATAMTTLSLGGRIAGGIALMPLVVLAGIVLDLGVQFGERREFVWWKSVLFLALAGMAGNLICFVKRLFDPLGAFSSAGNLEDLFIAGSSHALFGFLAGLFGAGTGLTLRALRRHHESWRIRPAIEKSEMA